MAGLCSCRIDPLGPADGILVRTGPGGGAFTTRLPLDETRPIEPSGPKITRLTASVRNDSLIVRGRLGQLPRSSRYDPDQVGGWALQVFVDSDPSNAGYWMGFDYVVRGTEWSRTEGTFVTRRITLEDGYPGGWGPQSGVSQFWQNPRQFEIAVPLSCIGGGSPEMFLAVETYNTVACPECQGGVTQSFVEDVFASATNPRRLAAGSRPPKVRRPFALRVPVQGLRNSADADPRLALDARPRASGPSSRLP